MNLSQHFSASAFHAHFKLIEYMFCFIAQFNYKTLRQRKNLIYSFSSRAERRGDVNVLDETQLRGRQLFSTRFERNLCKNHENERDGAEGAAPEHFSPDRTESEIENHLATHRNEFESVIYQIREIQFVSPFSVGPLGIQ